MYYILFILFFATSAMQPGKLVDQMIKKKKYVVKSDILQNTLIMKDLALKIAEFKSKLENLYEKFQAEINQEAEESEKLTEPEKTRKQNEIRAKITNFHRQIAVVENKVNTKIAQTQALIEKYFSSALQAVSKKHGDICIEFNTIAYAPENKLILIDLSSDVIRELDSKYQSIEIDLSEIPLLPSATK